MQKSRCIHGNTISLDSSVVSRTDGLRSETDKVGLYTYIGGPKTLLQVNGVDFWGSGGKSWVTRGRKGERVNATFNIFAFLVHFRKIPKKMGKYALVRGLNFSEIIVHHQGGGRN